jgi:hypothetical protein
MPITPSSRIFNCLRCHHQAILCQQCDRGQRYCADQCRSIARKTSIKRANKKYQNTTKGRFNNAERQRRFRLSQTQKKKIVTDQGSPSKRSRDLLTVELCALKNRTKVLPILSKTTCHFCGSPIGQFFRVGFLKKRTVYPYISKRLVPNDSNKKE